MTDEYKTQIPSTLKLPETGFLRIKQVLQLIPVGRTTWLNGVKEGKYPAKYQISDNTVGWRVEDIKAEIDKIIAKGAMR